MTSSTEPVLLISLIYMPATNCILLCLYPLYITIEMLLTLYMTEHDCSTVQLRVPLRTLVVAYSILLGENTRSQAMIDDKIYVTEIDDGL